MLFGADRHAGDAAAKLTGAGIETQRLGQPVSANVTVPVTEPPVPSSSVPAWIVVPPV